MSVRLPSGIWLHGALESAEQLLNPLIRRDTAALSQLAALSGRVLRVHCTQPDLALLIWPSAQGLHFERDLAADVAEPDAGQPVDAEVQGRLTDFIRFMLAGDRQEALLFEGALTLRGDTGLVRRLQQILSGLDLDLSALSEKLLGVVPTAALAAPLAGLMSFRARLGKTALLDWQEYLQYEISLLPPEAEQQGFTDGVLQVRRSVERLDARIQRLQQQLAHLQEAASSASDTSPSPDSHL